jgi:hypothetical protein
MEDQTLAGVLIAMGWGIIAIVLIAAAVRLWMRQ